MTKIKGNLKINFCSAVDSDMINHSSSLAKEMILAKGGSFDLPMDALNPVISDDDFVEFPFRQLSATLVGGGSWKATDFSDEKVLKASMKLLEEKPVYLNHDLRVGNEIGVVGKAKWSTSYVNKKGVKIPAGIDAPMRIDGVLYPQYVRKMSGKTPSVKSSSVTVNFEWEASHEFERPNDFYWHLGEMIDGTMVRRIVTKITDYYESSLVWLGADPFAGILDEDGEVKYVDMDGVVSLQASQPIKELFDSQNKFVIDFCLGRKKSLSLGKSENNLNENEMNEVLEKLALSLGVKAEELTPEMIAQYSFLKVEELDKLKLDAEKGKDTTELDAITSQLDTANLSVDNLTKKVSTLESEVVTLKADKSNLETKVTSLTAKGEFADSIFEKRKSYAVELYRKSYGDKASDTIVEELKGETSLEKLEVKIEMFGGKAINTFGGKCKKCKSNEIEFRSSQEDDSSFGNEDLADDSMSFIDKVISNH
jgi:hypothetical protein